jgi:hypothetical protein
MSPDSALLSSAAHPPTLAEYIGLQAAFEHFNKTLEAFGGLLDNPMIVLARRARAGGHFHEDRFVAREGGETCHELGLNPDHFFGRNDKEILSVLVHEMCHADQTRRGVAPRKNYHNRDFAATMKRVGLHPSNTGRLAVGRSARA